MRVYTLSDMRSEKKLRVYTASEAKGLTGKVQMHVFFIHSNVEFLSSFRNYFTHFTETIAKRNKYFKGGLIPSST